MNNPSQFARRFSSSAAAIAAEVLSPSSLGASAAPFHQHEQRSAYSRSVGRARFGRCRQAPVRVFPMTGRGQGFDLLTTCRGQVSAPGLFIIHFRLRRHCNAFVANTESLSNRALQCFSQGFESQLGTSVRCASNTPREAEYDVPEIRAFGTPDDC